MLTKFHFYIVFFPFVSVLFLGVLFLLLQLFSNKNYLSNLLTSFLVVFFLLLILIYEFSSNLNSQKNFYLIFAYLCNSFIFMCLIQSTISGLQLTLLRIIKLNPGISRKEILKKYNSNHIFEERIRRLEMSGIIYKKRTSFFLKDKKIILYFNFYSILQKMFNIKNK